MSKKCEIEDKTARRLRNVGKTIRIPDQGQRWKNSLG